MSCRALATGALRPGLATLWALDLQALWGNLLSAVHHPPRCAPFRANKGIFAHVATWSCQVCPSPPLSTRAVHPTPQAQRRIARKVEQFLSGKDSKSSEKTGAHCGSNLAGGSPGALRNSPRQATADTPSAAGVLCSAIDAAINGCIQAGLLPATQYPEGRASKPSPKQQRLLPSNIRLAAP